LAGFAVDYLKTMTLALGIDPGTATTGYGLVRLEPDGSLAAVKFGVITTPKDSSASARLEMLYGQLNDLLSLHHPDTAAVEKLFFQRNVSTAIAVGQARGVVMLCLSQHKLDVFEYTPNEVKQAVAGYGSADKRQVQEMVRTLLLLPEVPKPDDAADALAVAITHLNTKRY
jgi:crossover junction endodeoxyribonuclease RuvC